MKLSKGWKIFAWVFLLLGVTVAFAWNNAKFVDWRNSFKKKPVK